jgi:hypothetical protein
MGDGSDREAVGPGVGAGPTAGLDSEAEEAVLAGVSVSGPPLLHPASHGTANVGAARPRPMIMRRVN